LLGKPSHLPWEEWWPSLGRCNLISILLRPPGVPTNAQAGEVGSALDRVWAALQTRPELANTPSPEGRPIIIALQQGHRDIAELLSISGATLRGRVADDLLYESAMRGNTGPISLLLCDALGKPRSQPWACPNARPTRHGGTPLDIAVTRGNSQCAEIIRRCGGYHSLHWAAKNAIPTDVAKWLASGACADERDGSGATPLWHAVRGPNAQSTPVRQAVPEKSSSSGDGEESPRGSCIAMLLKAGATVDVLPITLETPLLIAAARGDVRRCSQLLEARADPTVADRDGHTPLQRAKGEDVRALLSRAAQEGADDHDMFESGPAPFLHADGTHQHPGFLSGFNAIPMSPYPAADNLWMGNHNLRWSGLPWQVQASLQTGPPVAWQTNATSACTPPRTDWGYHYC